MSEEIIVDLNKFIDNFCFNKEIVQKKYNNDYEKIALDLAKDNQRLAFEKVELELKAKKINNIIDKAIEYINNCEDIGAVNDYSFPTKPIIDNQAKKELLDILKGSDKE